MGSNRVLNALAQIDDRLVLEAYLSPTGKKRKPWLPWLASAAVIGLCVFGIWKMGLWSRPVQPEIIYTEPEQPAEEVNWEAVKQKLLTCPESGPIAEEIKLEFLYFFQKNYDESLQLTLNADWSFSEEERPDVIEEDTFPTPNTSAKSSKPSTTPQKHKWRD